MTAVTTAPITTIVELDESDAKWGAALLVEETFTVRYKHQKGFDLQRGYDGRNDVDLTVSNVLQNDARKVAVWKMLNELAQKYHTVCEVILQSLVQRLADSPTFITADGRSG